MIYKTYKNLRKLCLALPGPLCPILFAVKCANIDPYCLVADMRAEAYGSTCPAPVNGSPCPMPSGTEGSCLRGTCRGAQPTGGCRQASLTEHQARRSHVGAHHHHISP